MSELLSRRDLTDEEVRKDCLHELERLPPDAWIRRWGGALRSFLGGDMEHDVEALREEVRELEQELESAGGVSAEDMKSVREALRALETGIEKGESRDALLDLFETLDGAVDELAACA